VDNDYVYLHDICTELHSSFVNQRWRNSNMLKPIADFTSSMTGDCTGFGVQLTDQSTNCSTSWSWDLGNSKTTSIQNPTHSAYSGAFSVAKKL
jgi:PKD repeat protein